MVTQIDHIVIAVRNLDEASRDYARAGFNVLPGGEHTGGATHNALVTFSDGAYFELIAFTQPEREPDPPHRWWNKLAKGEGLVDYAVLSEDLAQEAAEIQDRGAAIDGPYDGGRIRPDGQRVAWRTLRSSDSEDGLPFIIDDLTPRPLRVPNGASSHHPGSFNGVSGLTIVVVNLAEAERAYADVLGTKGEAVTSPIAGAGASRRFSIGDHWVDLVEPDETQSALRAQLEGRGSGPFEIALNGNGADGEYLPESATHGVRIRIER
jgi:catechol 2,3-dioxygenase-like lactoylglutathione lyase family enzyme